MSQPVVVMDLSGSAIERRSLWMDIIGCCLQHGVPVYGSHFNRTWKLIKPEDVDQGFNNGATDPATIFAGIEETGQTHVIFFTDDYPWDPGTDREVDDERMTVIHIPNQYDQAIPGVGPVPAFTVIRLLKALSLIELPDQQ